MKKMYVIILIVLATLVATVHVLIETTFKAYIALKGDSIVKLEVQHEYQDAGVEAYIDNLILKRQTIIPKQETDLNINQVGEYTINYILNKKSIHEEVKRTIKVVDETPPTITLKGEETIRLPYGTEYQEPGYELSDNYTTDLEKYLQITTDLDNYKQGTYTITYTLKDENNNETIKTRTIEVYIQTVTPTGKTIYLTFDDGPGPYTNELLDILKTYNVKATFFVTGQFPGYANSIKRAYEEGHTIAVHTNSHRFNEIYQSEEAFLNDVNAINNTIENKTGKRSTIIRFAGGSSNTISGYNKGIMTRLTKLVKEQGYNYFDWNVDSKDAGGAHTKEEVFKNVINGLGNKKVNVVLQHDIKKYSIEAIPMIVEYAKAKGYEFKGIDMTTPEIQHSVLN